MGKKPSTDPHACRAPRWTGRPIPMSVCGDAVLGRASYQAFLRRPYPMRPKAGMEIGHLVHGPLRWAAAPARPPPERTIAA